MLDFLLDLMCLWGRGGGDAGGGNGLFLYDNNNEGFLLGTARKLELFMVSNDLIFYSNTSTTLNSYIFQFSGSR